MDVEVCWEYLGMDPRLECHGLAIESTCFSCGLMKPPIHGAKHSGDCTRQSTLGVTSRPALQMDPSSMGPPMVFFRFTVIAGGETQGERGEGKGSCRLGWDGFAARRLDQNHRSDNEKNCTAGCIGWDGLGVSLSFKRLLQVLRRLVMTL